MRLALAFMLAASVLGSGCGHNSGVPGLDSGIEGVATAGPTCPVAVAGQYCPPKPISAVVAVQDGSGREVTRFITGGDGRFRVPLAPGSYILVQPPSPPMPRLMQPMPVTVTAGRYTSIQLDFDTGIR